MEGEPGGAVSGQCTRAVSCEDHSRRRTRPRTCLQMRQPTEVSRVGMGLIGVSWTPTKLCPSYQQAQCASHGGARKSLQSKSRVGMLFPVVDWVHISFSSPALPILKGRNPRWYGIDETSRLCKASTNPACDGSTRT
eukprot:694829-Rhodomonas_salina.1